MGVDPAEVQRNACGALGLEGPPAVDIAKRRPKDPKAELALEVFWLRSGQATQVRTEPKNYVSYKVIDRENITEADLKQVISRQLTNGAQIQRKYEVAAGRVACGVKRSVFPDLSSHNPGTYPQPA